MKKIFIFLILGIFLISFTSASFLGSLGKDNVCTMLNLSGSDCDYLWCEEVIECEFSLERDACICYETIEGISVLNESYYNTTEIQSIISALNLSLVDLIESSNFVMDINYSITNETILYIDDKIKNQTFNFDSKIRNLEKDFDGSSSKLNSDFNPLWLLLIAVAGVVGFMFFKGQSSKEEKSSYSRGEAKTGLKKIQTKEEMSKDEEIRTLKEQIEIPKLPDKRDKLVEEKPIKESKEIKEENKEIKIPKKKIKKIEKQQEKDKK